MSNRHGSMRFTVGTLLRHALESGASVRILVEGTWLDGVPLACDEMGVLLDSDTHQSLIKLSSVSAVSIERSALEDEPRVGHEAMPREAYPSQRASTEDVPATLNLVTTQ